MIYFEEEKKQNSQLYNCIFITLPLATNGTELFAVSDRTYKKRAFQSQEVAITTSNTFLRRHLFSSTTCIRSGFCAATCKKRGLQIDFALILYHITEQSVFTFYYFDKSPDIEKI